MQGFKVFFPPLRLVWLGILSSLLCAREVIPAFFSISGQYNCPLLYRLCAHIHVRISHPASLVWLGHRQISPSLSYLHDMTFLACGACGILSCIRSSLADRQYRPARSATLRAGCAIGNYSPHGNPPSLVSRSNRALVAKKFHSGHKEKGGDIHATAYLRLFQVDCIHRLSPHLLSL